MQWLGGIGIVVMATILPLLKVGGMQLLKWKDQILLKKFYLER